MNYVHRGLHGEPLEYPPGKVVCVGRNYTKHAAELGNTVPDTPMLFIKPATALVDVRQPLRLPRHGNDIHYETEMAVLIGRRLTGAHAQQVPEAIAGYAIALDLTARDVQSMLKEKSYPWEIAKGFDGACPMGLFIPPSELADPQNTSVKLLMNGEVRQDGSTAQMVFPVNELIAYISSIFTLLAGDVVLTGTPEGVGPLNVGDRMELILDRRFSVHTTVVSDDAYRDLLHLDSQ